jgi:hypothetical protein
MYDVTGAVQPEYVLMHCVTSNYALQFIYKRQLLVQFQNYFPLRSQRLFNVSENFVVTPPRSRLTKFHEDRVLVVLDFCQYHLLSFYLIFDRCIRIFYRVTEGV